MMEFKEMIVYIWVFFFSLIVGVLSFFKKRGDTDMGFRLGAFVLGVACSMVVGYITFEVSMYYFEKEKFAVALAGLGAWMGTDALLSFQGAFKELIKGRLK